MRKPVLFRLLRDATAIAVVGLFMFPLFWWGLMSIKPASAIFDKDRVIWFDFTPTAENYLLTISEGGPEALSGMSAFIDSIVIAAGSTALSVTLGLMAAFALSRLPVRRAGAWLRAALFFRFLPPIAIIVPAVLVLHQGGLFDTRLGVMLMHTVLNLPIAVLMLKSFLDEVPREVDDAARIDGASGLQLLTRILIPLSRGGIAATAIICFIFSWTEFLMALFLSLSFRTIPVKLSILSLSAWGPLAALGTLAILPGFVFILLVQRHLVRGLTLGVQK
jgi:multiple sugar transport system permease protein